LWIGLVKSAYDQAGGEDAEENKITVKEYPDPVEDVGDKGLVEEGKGKGEAKENGEKSKVEEKKVETPIPAAPKITPKEKIRHDWYQSAQSVTIDLLAAGVPKDQVEANFEARSVSSYGLAIVQMLTYLSLRSASQSLTLEAPSTLHFHHSMVPSIQRSHHIGSHRARSKSPSAKHKAANGPI
jgi:hypothetical protein